MDHDWQISMAARGEPPVAGLVPWDLDALDAEMLAVAYEELADFVDSLVLADVDVPRCWYVHGWVVHRLKALERWHRDAHVPAASARDAADWWAFGIAALSRDWQPLHGHRNGHPPIGHPWEECVPTPPLWETVIARVRGRREARA